MKLHKMEINHSRFRHLHVLSIQRISDMYNAAQVNLLNSAYITTPRYTPASTSVSFHSQITPLKLFLPPFKPVPLFHTKTLPSHFTFHTAKIIITSHPLSLPPSPKLSLHHQHTILHSHFHSKPKILALPPLSLLQPSTPEPPTLFHE